MSIFSFLGKKSGEKQAEKKLAEKSAEKSISSSENQNLKTRFFKKINYKKFLGVLLFLIIILLGLTFAPFLWASNSAESLVKNVENGKTIQTHFDLFSPEYGVFSKTESYGSKVSFVDLKRSWLIFWEPEIKSNLEFFVPDNLSQEQKKDLQDKNLQGLQDAVKNGKINKQSQQMPAEMDELTKSILKEKNQNEEPGRDRFSLEDISQKNKLTVVNDLKYPENKVLLNGNLLPEIKNVFSVDFEMNDNVSEYIYFTDFEVFDEVREIKGAGEDGYGTVQFLGAVKRYSISKKTVENLRQFEPGVLSVKANKEKLLMFDYEGNGQVMDLKSKNLKDVVLPASVKNSLQDEHDFFVEVLDIGAYSAIVKVYAGEKVLNLRVNLQTGESEIL